MRGLEARACAHLDRRLLPSRAESRARPIAVALSGGGDSVALLLIADAWAQRAGRDLIVLTVDHGLNPDSSSWTETCARLAARLGWPLRALAWAGEKPTRGLPAAARAARHRLLADAARQRGAAVILMGHTADDVLEARRMRAAGATTPEPRVWAPSPAWPEGRGVFLLRPLLQERRAALRNWLSARGEAWIEDPANADARYARARARTLAAGDDTPKLIETAPLEIAFEDRLGVLCFDRSAFRAKAERLVALACVCAGGGDRLPAADRIGRVATALGGTASFVATLAGARIEADDGKVRIFREAGEAARGGLAGLSVQTGETAVWDGRFEITPAEPVLVRRLAGLSARLPREQQAALQAVPAAARGALPAIVAEEGASCPLLLPGAHRARSLVGERLRAAAGLIAREPD